MRERRKTVAEIIASKMEQRLTVGGIRSEEAELLDELLGADYSVCPLVDSSVSAGSGRGAPSGGSLPLPAETIISPPTTNRGVSKRLCVSESLENHPLTSFGGADGGVEIGFEVEWNAAQKSEVVAILQSAKERASESMIGEELVEVCGQTVSVDASGARAGLHYHYKFKYGGVTFFIHRNPPKGYQGVRVRYGATALIGRSLYDVHAAVREFFTELGITVLKETVSRVDLQVTMGFDPQALFSLICNGHAVSKVRNDVLYRKSGSCRTYLVGQRGRMQLCIYDKSAELKVMAVSNPAKFQLMVDEHLGNDYSFDDPLCRIEFRLWRDVLRLFEINTVEDLRKAETDLVSWLTTKWFRVLSVPKAQVKGRENRTSVASLWEAVHKAFVFWFPGDGRPVSDITLNREKRTVCEPEALLKQAGGCLKSALALQLGAECDSVSAFERLFFWVENVKQEVFEGLKERAHKLGVVTGIKVGCETMVSDAKRRADDWLRSLEYERRLCVG